MLIGQLTDIHIGFDRQSPREANLVRLDAAVARLLSSGHRPDLVLLTGDLTEHGDAESYAQLTAALAPLECPCWPIPGNHDQRAPLAAAFPAAKLDGGFLHYAIEQADFRILMLDTLEPGRHGGGFCEARARWLAGKLAERPDTPTFIAMHHPPFPAGIPWMDTHPGEPWVARLAATLAGHRQIVGLTSGHVHRATFCAWAGIPAMICPSTAPAVGLDFSPLDPAAPDQRVLIADEPIGLMLHVWDGARLVSHAVGGAEPTVFARFTPQLQGMVQDMVAERPSD